MSSRTLHEWLKRRLAFITLKIRHGPLQGKSWNISSGSKFTRGEYEPENTQAIEALVPGSTQVDVEPAGGPVAHHRGEERKVLESGHQRLTGMIAPDRNLR